MTGGTTGCKLVAEVAYAGGEVIHRIVPSRVSSRADRWTIQAGKALHLNDPAIQHMNHSCEPTAVIDVVRREVIAQRDIAPGQEISFFYPSTEWDMAEPFACRCQAERCLGFIAGARHLPSGVLERYWVNPHIRALAGAPPSAGLGSPGRG